MKDEKFRKALSEMALDHGFEDGVILLDNHAYDKSIVGITEDGRLVYNFEQMVEEFAEDEGCDETEALEWLEYNTLRALPYMGEHAPIIISASRDGIIERYGD